MRGKAGLYPELKDPAFYRERGVSPETLLADVLKKNGLLDDPTTPVIIQSFDEQTVKALAKELPHVPRVFLVEPRDGCALDTSAEARARSPPGRPASDRTRRSSSTTRSS